ncbi:MAG TPA: hypothetical protein VLV17_06740 [Anaeromyxobacteraceae bacterium]|nr:hypothetical protein [Anaeromyxobacteraceae bacterium]
MTAHILLFALEDLRERYGAGLPTEADPRQDTTPFRTFRAALLEALASEAKREAEVSMWWEGSYNGYALAVAVDPGEAIHDLESAAERACPVEAARLANPRRARYRLGRVWPGRAEVSREDDGAVVEAPFGAGGGHFGAPGMRRVP